MDGRNQALSAWVDEAARLTKPDQVVWLDGSEAEYQALLAEGVRQGQLIPLNPTRHPGSYLHRSHPNDVARSEQRTYICTPAKEDAGPTNNWLSPDEAHATLRGLFDGAMRGRTMYVVPYLLGPPGSPFSRVGIELTDSVYVAVNMRIMTRMGAVALRELGGVGEFFRGLHSVGTLDAGRRYICHFPQERAVCSINSGYGGNALLSKKCVALRLGSWLGRQEGWLAEHMLIMGVEDPDGQVIYLAAAFPSACGKTNLAMLRPAPPHDGYKVWCVGDDIAWLRPGPDGRLYAVNPEAGFFGVAPGTSPTTNPQMMRTIDRNTIFTNVGLLPDKTVWWEGLEPPPRADGMVDWQGRPWSPASGTKAAHPNSRFTAPIRQCPVFSPTWDDPAGVPISAILFGARRSAVAPLIYEARSWQHGVYLGATLASETTAAATGAVGVLRRDPMAMLPFCGYNMADYFGHWLELGRRLAHPPRIFRVNWFRKDAQGRDLWPGFGENIRVIRWAIERCRGRAAAVESPLGLMPTPEALGADSLPISSEGWSALLGVDRAEWLVSVPRQSEFFDRFGDRLPDALRQEQRELLERLRRAE